MHLQNFKTFYFSIQLNQYKILSKKDTLNPNISLSRLSATQNKIKNNLDNSIALFHFCGHGSEPDKLLLNFGKEMIDSAFFENYTFKNNPLFFINCCLSGTLEYYGGGKFNGLPITLFKQGAEAIISCTYPIRDNPSKFFSLYFYEKLHTHFLHSFVLKFCHPEFISEFITLIKAISTQYKKCNFDIF